jgi:hypothetical protein
MMRNLTLIWLARVAAVDLRTCVGGIAIILYGRITGDELKSCLGITGLLSSIGRLWRVSQAG